MFVELILAVSSILSNQRWSLDPLLEMDIYQQALENPHLVGGDMIMPSGSLLGNAIADESYRWPDATVPYVIHASLYNEKALIEQAMKHYMDNTCVKFVKRTFQKEYVKFFRGDGCYSFVGRNKTGSQPQPLSLGHGCHKIGTIIHEIGHALGFYHEQNRSDRDEYIDIHLENVQSGMWSNFIKLTPEQNILVNKFDYDSIMIYGNYAFSKYPNLLKTIEAKNGQVLENPYKKMAMTKSDIERVRKIYKCK